MRQPTEEELLKRLNAVIETAIDGIVMINSHGIIESVNQATIGLFGYQRSELLGKNVSILMNSDHRDQHNHYIHNYETTGEAKIIGKDREVFARKKDGTVFPIRIAVSQFVVDENKYYTGIIHDLSDVWEAREEILKLNKKLEERVVERTNSLESVVNKLLSTNVNLEREVQERKAVEQKLLASEVQLKNLLSQEKNLNELKTRFLTMASHEFRTPLTSIKSSAGLIRKYKDGEGQLRRERHVSRIFKAVDHLTQVLEDFLYLGRLEEGHIELRYASMELMELLEEVHQDLETLIGPDRKVVINLCPKIELYSDKKILKHILLNVMSNALKYSKQDIQVSIQEDELGVQITIEDKGIGIPEAELKHLFDRFYRADNALNIEGTGLGLHIVKQYLDLLEGRVEIRSVVDQGTVCTIWLPSNKSKKE